MSDSLQPHESQHARPPCPSPTPRVRSDSHPSSQWCHPAISSSVVPGIEFSSVQFSHSVVPDSLRPHESQSITNSQSSLRFTSIESVMPSSHLILCRPLLLLPPIPPSIKVFSNEPTLRMRWPKYWSFSFSIIPSKELRLNIILFFYLDFTKGLNSSCCLCYAIYQ